VRTGREARARLGGAAALGARRLLLVVAFAAVAGCGQRGPLTLPDSARPIQRLDPAAQPPAGAPQPGTAAPGGAAPATPGAATGTTPPAQREPGSDEDRSKEQGKAPENER
jgi:predicted small lipoprotein YifL